jgi:hypothetical protein
MRNSQRKVMTLHFSPPLDAYDAAVDDAIATCNGDLRGALKALIIANEFLERDLQKALASYAAPSIADDENTGRAVRKLSKLACVNRREIQRGR